MNQGAKQLIKDIFVFSMGTVMTKLIQFLLMPLYTSSLTTEAYGAAEPGKQSGGIFSIRS